MDYFDHTRRLEQRLETQGYADSRNSRAAKGFHAQPPKGRRRSPGQFLHTVIVYFPLVTGGYLISQQLLAPGSSLLVTMGVALLLAVVAHLLFRLVATMVFSSKVHRHSLRVLYVASFVIVAIGLPLLVTYLSIHDLVLTLGGNTMISLLVTGCYGLFLFWHYRQYK